MTTALVRLDPPASLTPEVRAWIGQHADVALTRGRTEDGRSALLLRIRIADAEGEESAAVEDYSDQVADLITDLRLLGLRPSLVSAEPALAPENLDDSAADGLEQAGAA